MHDHLIVITETEGCLRMSSAYVISIHVSMSWENR